MWRAPAILGLLGALLLASADDAQEPPSAGGDRWSKIEHELKSAAGFDDTWDRRPMWGYLSDYLHAQRQQTSETELGKQIVARWADAGDARKFTPLLVDRKYSLAASRQVGSVTWRSESVDSFCACLLPLPGQVVLFAYPASAAASPRDIYYRHLRELDQLRLRGYLEAQVHQRLRNEIQRMGQDRWAFVFLRLYPRFRGTTAKFRTSTAMESDTSFNSAIATRRFNFRTKNCWGSGSDVRWMIGNCLRRTIAACTWRSIRHSTCCNPPDEIGCLPN